MTTRSADNSSGSKAWYLSLAEAEFDSLHLHVRMVYPNAGTQQTVLETFRSIRDASHPRAHATARSWLRCEARRVALSGVDDTTAWRSRNGAIIRIEWAGAEWQVTADRDTEAEATASALADLSVDELEILRMTAIEEDLTLDELSEILELPSSEAHQRLNEARKTFTKGYRTASRRLGVLEEVGDDE